MDTSMNTSMNNQSFNENQHPNIYNNNSNNRFQPRFVKPILSPPQQQQSHKQQQQVQFNMNSGGSNSVSPIMSSGSIQTQRQSQLQQLAQRQTNQIHVNREPHEWYQLIDIEMFRFNNESNYSKSPECIKYLTQLYNQAMDNITENKDTPEYASFLLGRANFQYKCGEYEDSKNTLKYMKISKIKSVEIFVLLARIEVDSNNFSKARSSINRGIQKNPKMKRELEDYLKIIDNKENEFKLNGGTSATTNGGNDHSDDDHHEQDQPMYINLQQSNGLLNGNGSINSNGSSDSMITMNTPAHLRTMPSQRTSIPTPTSSKFSDSIKTTGLTSAPRRVIHSQLQPITQSPINNNNNNNGGNYIDDHPMDQDDQVSPRTINSANSSNSYKSEDHEFEEDDDDNEDYEEEEDGEEQYEVNSPLSSSSSTNSANNIINSISINDQNDYENNVKLQQQKYQQQQQQLQYQQQQIQPHRFSLQTNANSNIPNSSSIVQNSLSNITPNNLPLNNSSSSAPNTSMNSSDALQHRRHSTQNPRVIKPPVIPPPSKISQQQLLQKQQAAQQQAQQLLLQQQQATQQQALQQQALQQQQLLQQQQNKIAQHQQQKQQNVPQIKPQQQQQAQPQLQLNENVDKNASFEIAKNWSEVAMVNNKPYLRIEFIGKGGSGKVYKVLSRELKVYALKYVCLNDPSEVESQLNEIEMLKRLRKHINIIQLIDYEVNLPKGYILLVLEFGEIDLSKCLQRLQTPMGTNVNFIRIYWQQMLQAVHTIHEEKIIHGDLKPANFVSVQGSLKLIDFGIAKAIQSDDTTNIVRDSQIGTINYISPEALIDTSQGGGQGKQCMKLGRASDIWSLGCILYEMAFGFPPFKNLSLFAKYQAITNPNHKIEYPVHPNDNLLKVLKLCLIRNPQERASIPMLLDHDFLKI